jgi:hypothetical protein
MLWKMTLYSPLRLEKRLEGKCNLHVNVRRKSKQENDMKYEGCWTKAPTGTTYFK